MPHPQDVAVPSLPEPKRYIWSNWRHDAAAPPIISHNSGPHADWDVEPIYSAEEVRAAVIADRAAGRASAEPEGWRSALKFYADRCHFMLSNEDAWDTVSGEPGNFWCDEEGTATVEDGTVAARALAGDPLPDEEEDAAPTPTASSAPKAGE